MKKLSFKNRLFYSSGVMGYSLVDRIITTWLMYYYLPPEGAGQQLIPAAIFGAIMIIGRVVDAVADPIIGFLSDRTNSRWGRRTPYLVGGGLPLVATTILLFYPPIQGVSQGNTIYLAILLSLFFIAFTTYVCPYLALLPELGKTAKERINLTTYQAMASLIGVVLGMVLSGILIDYFGFKAMAWILGLLSLLLLYLPVYGVVERDYCQERPSSLDFISSIKMTLQNRPFLFYLSGYILFWFGFNITTLSVPYYVTLLLKQPEGYTSFLLAATFGVSFLAFAPINSLAKRKGRKWAFLLSMILFSLFLPLLFFMGEPLLGINPQVIAFFVMGLLGIPLAGLFILPNAILADITDLDKKNSKESRPAIYFGAQGIFVKMAYGISTLFLTLLFSHFGYSPSQTLGVRLTGPISALFVLGGILLFIHYQEGEER